MSRFLICRDDRYTLLGYVAEIDGAKCKTLDAFLEEAWSALKFPQTQKKSLDDYTSNLKDLSWIKEDVVTILIKNYEELLSEHARLKPLFSLGFKNTIFPYWKGKGKDVNVICLEELERVSKMVSTEDIANNIDDHLAPVPVASAPVLRVEDGELYLAFFVYFCSDPQLEASMEKRPSVWMLADLSTGEIVARYDCRKRDFSTAGHDKLYYVSYSEREELSYDYTKSVCAILDEVRREYLKTKKLNKRLYEKYLGEIIEGSPSGFARFYEDLSNVELI